MPERCGRLAGVAPARSPASDLVARYAVVLDACVLVPIALADTLLRLAERDLYRPLWSARIVAEATDATIDIHPEIPPERVQRRFAAMDDAFEDACVEGWETLEHTVTLPDADDRHVVAAAMGGRAARRPRLGDRVGSGFLDDSGGLHPGLGRRQALVERVDGADAGRDTCPA